MKSISMNVATRRMFLAAGAGSMAGLVLTGRSAAASIRRGRTPPGFPHQDPDLVQKVVRFSHFDLDAVRQLVSARPALAKASWDWGFGDWESALGAASHTGQRGIADFLLAHGARPSIFTFAMLGRLDAVRAMIDTQPGVQSIPGPHGITLLQHARNGGDEAAAVVAYLEELGDADPRAANEPLAAAQMQAYLGIYMLDVVTGASFEIVDLRGQVSFAYGDESPRGLMHQGDHEFHPVGAPAVRFRFDVREGHAHTVTITDGETMIAATRHR